MTTYWEVCFIVNIVGWQIQIVLKSNNTSNHPKIPYIVDSDYKKRNCYARNLNYLKFENRILEIIRNVCKIYANRSLLEDAYKNAENKSIDILLATKKQIEEMDINIANINRKLDNLYDDKLNGILIDIDFKRISEKFILEREKLIKEKSKLMDRFQEFQGHQAVNSKSDEEKMNKIINEFLEMKEISKSCLFRLIDKIEIDKDKNIFITFNFAPLNTINETIDEFIEIEEILNKD